jgi:hypothetical protein
MTVIATVRTGSAVIFATDSKVTTKGIVGSNPDGTPIWLPQTYDNAVKLVHDSTVTTVAAFCGTVNIGKQTATDYFARKDIDLRNERHVQDVVIGQLADDIVENRRKACADLRLPAEASPDMAMIVAGPSEPAPRIWRLAFSGDAVVLDEILKNAGLWLEGSYDAAFSLLYGYHPIREVELKQMLGVNDDDFAKAQKATSTPLSQMNFWSMPIQDAMDFAVFCVTAQIEMERFLPGNAACGGPIDVMVLETSPQTVIRSFPGKRLHHPRLP